MTTNSSDSEATDEYVRLGDFAHDRLGMQTQYASRYLTGVGREQTIRPRFADDLRWDGGSIDLSRTEGVGGDYHSIRVHRDDVDELVRRINDYRVETGQIAAAPAQGETTR